MKRRKGFTLIELLAVIVILAIIAVIATPIIVGIIEDSRKAAFERSVEGIIHATDIDFGTQETLSNFTYEIKDGEVTNTTLKVPIKNLEGFSGTIKYDDKGNSEYALHNDKWCMKKDSSGITTEEYVVDECIIEVALTADLSKAGNPVYFDVLKGKLCNNYHDDNSLTGYNGIYEGENKTSTTSNQNSCLKFYVFNYTEGDERVNLLLDHNTTALVDWNSGGSNKNGPKEVIEQLKVDTNLWNGTMTPPNYKVSQSGSGEYEIDYSEYKARLITANEVAQITGADKEGVMFDENTTSYSDGFYEFSTNTQVESDTCTPGRYNYETGEMGEPILTGCRFRWLYDRTKTDCEKYGCLNNADSGMTATGYWTATSCLDTVGNAWKVSFGGTWYSNIDYFDYNAGGGGVRPVIEVLRSNL